MVHLGTLSGIGLLSFNATHCGEVQYRFDVYRGRYAMSGSGALTWDSMVVSAIQDGEYQLQLQSGEKMNIEILRPDGDGATMLFSGTVPGF